jgi:hypothetical protein
VHIPAQILPAFKELNPCEAKHRLQRRFFIVIAGCKQTHLLMTPTRSTFFPMVLRYATYTDSQSVCYNVTRLTMSTLLRSPINSPLGVCTTPKMAVRGKAGYRIAMRIPQLHGWLLNQTVLPCFVHKGASLATHLACGSADPEQSVCYQTQLSRHTWLSSRLC